MDNLRSVIRNLFCYMPVLQILELEDCYEKISEELFVKLGSSYIRQYSNDELRNMYHNMRHEFKWQNRRITGFESRSGDSGDNLNVFDTLVAFNFSVLIEENGVPLCQYVHLLRWREMITALEEDLFVTSFLALCDIQRGVTRKNFFWKPVIGHNNFALNRLMQEGLAENHFHLKGSAPAFHLSWINMMNDPDSQRFAKILRDYDEHMLQREMKVEKNRLPESYAVMWRQAALIRVFLYSVLQNDFLEAPDEFCAVEGICRACSKDAVGKAWAFFEEKGLKQEDRVRMKEYEAGLEREIGREDLIRVKRYVGEQWLQRLLESADGLERDCGLIKSNIDRLRDKYCADDAVDYVLCDKLFTRNEKQGLNEVICGERWFMYAMFTYIYGENRYRQKKYINWFYAYLVIKAHIRSEIIQVNMNVGFDNFLQYQFRKEQFIEDTALEAIYLKMAVRDTIYNQSLVSLEARIVPKRDAEKLAAAIRKYDAGACLGLEENKEEREELLSKFYYVVHFTKEPDEKPGGENDIVRCRHFLKREEVREQAQAIARLRERGYPESARIRGIDACSPEIVCRPEVFAQAFRYLKNHTPQGVYTEAGFESVNLMATYHVGEDFLDLADGLRAIDEAISFLNLRCGDRLGHALALGVDVDEWYEGKSNHILISKQAYMDNLVWLYAKLRKYNIADAEDAQSYIEKRFDDYFQEIYRNNISAQEYEKAVEDARKYYADRKENHGYRNTVFNMGINEYYNAWKLRGDAPELYRNGYFAREVYQADKWEDCAVNRIFPQNYVIRYHPEAAFLYRTYHYNRKVREIGEEMVEVKVLPCMIRAVSRVQKRLQREVSDLGIAIETNPSSNYLIGSFRRYDKHPVTVWYNNSLTHDEESLKKCPQIQVSINTDDQGVFATYLENEYAYLALALEKHVDEHGERVYNRTLILKWLDDIRRMGIHMRFGRKSEV